jgi:hypothetical protein
MTMKISVPRLTSVLMAMTLLCLMGIAQADDRGEGPLNPAQPTGITPEEIIQKFAAKEAQFKLAREQYTWRQDVTVQTLDGNTVDGEYRQVIDILFDDRGRRVEHVVFAPQSTLQRISMSREDFEDIEKRLPFVLTSEEIPDYDILYVGQQKEDELNTYVFDVAPKKIEKNRRYFQGRIWVDNQDFQIVKTKGKNVPDIVTKNNENLFPPFTTWRQQVDSQDGSGNVYWFPVYTETNDTLHFKNQDVHIKQIVKYMNYKRFGSKVKITYEGQDIGPGSQQPGEPPPATPPPANPKK